jgi:hypothetical protein
MQRSAFKAIIRQTMHQHLNKLTFVNVGAFTPFFEQFFPLYVIKKLLKFTESCKNEYICKKSSNQEMFAISLLSCNRYNANFKLDQSVFAIHDSPDDNPIVGHPRPRSLMNFRLR